MLAKQWLENARNVMGNIEDSQMDNIKKAATVMADSIEKGRWVNTFGCGHATLPIEEMYPRIGGFVGFHRTFEFIFEGVDPGLPGVGFYLKGLAGLDHALVLTQ